MKTLVLDSHALLVYFEQEEGWQTVSEILQLASEDKHHLVLSMINWGEVYYVTMREYDEIHAEKVLDAIKNMPIELKEVNKEVTLLAARMKAEGGMSYADCFAAALSSMTKGSEVVTGDKEFRQVENKIKVRWIK